MIVHLFCQNPNPRLALPAPGNVRDKQIEHWPRRLVVWLTAVRLMNRQGTSSIMMQPTQQLVASFILERDA